MQHAGQRRNMSCLLDQVVPFPGASAHISACGKFIAAPHEAVWHNDNNKRRESVLAVKAREKFDRDWWADFEMIYDKKKIGEQDADESAIKLPSSMAAFIWSGYFSAMFGSMML